MRRRWERRAIRAAGVATFTLALTFAIRTRPPEPVPGWALRNSLIYFLELVLAIVGLVYALLTLAIHTVSRGAVPTTISKEGFSWAQGVTQLTDEALAGVQDQIDSFEADLREIEQRILAIEGVR